MMDMLSSEYGWTHHYIMKCLTPMQVMVYTGEITKRKARELVINGVLVRTSVWGDQDSFSALLDNLWMIEKQDDIAEDIDRVIKVDRTVQVVKDKGFAVGKMTKEKADALKREARRKSK